MTGIKEYFTIVLLMHNRYCWEYLRITDIDEYIRYRDLFYGS